jgi:hypothetical protein
MALRATKDDENPREPRNTGRNACATAHQDGSRRGTGIPAVSVTAFEAMQPL